MSNFDYETGLRKPELAGSTGSNALGVLLLLAIVFGLVLLVSAFGNSTPSGQPGEARAPGEQPVADTPMPAEPAASTPAPATPAPTGN